MLILPETDAKGALRITEKLRKCIESEIFEYEDQLLRITMTFGLAVCNKEESIESLVARADAVLYEGKEQGRNRVVVSDLELEVEA